MAFVDGRESGVNISISFPSWKKALGSSSLPLESQNVHAREIGKFLGYCRRCHAPASVALAKRYLEEQGVGAEAPPRAALRWFVRAWRQDCALSMESRRREERSTLRQGPNDRTGSAHPQRGLPSAGHEDLGGADWERDLIVAVRRKGFLWRTETAYREWAQRFVTYLLPRSPYGAGGEDIAGFLSHLAVTQRVGAATQKQALNALVFFLQEALRRSVGEFDFHRAESRRRMPVVLSQPECQKLFGQLTGTNQLMAELMYGSGLRLMELLRL